MIGKTHDPRYDLVLEKGKVRKASYLDESTFGSYSDIQKVEKYLYEAYYDDLDYMYAHKYYKTHKGIRMTANCSIARYGDWIARNFDWIYNENAEFVVHVPATNLRYCSVGIATNVPGLTADFVESGDWSPMYKLVPFRIVDGMNEQGLFVGMNVVPLEGAPVKKSIPTNPDETKEELYYGMIPRYALDNFDNATDAVAYIADYVTVFFGNDLHEGGHDVHYYFADSAGNTLCLEFIDGVATVTDISDSPYLTNFFIDGVTFNDDGTVYTPGTSDETHNPIITNGITPHGTGLERYNLFVNGFKDFEVCPEDMQAFMETLYYTNAYKDSTSPAWLSEYAEGNLRLDSDPEKLEAVRQIAKEYYENRSRDPRNKYHGTWHTSHMSIYNVDELLLYVIAQEGTQALDSHYFTID